MTETATEVVAVPNSPAELVTPKFTPLEPNAAHTCDAHPTTYAVVSVRMPAWKASLLFCGHCARKNFGYEHTQRAVKENRQKGATTS